MICIADMRKLFAITGAMRRSDGTFRGTSGVDWLGQVYNDLIFTVTPDVIHVVGMVHHPEFHPLAVEFEDSAAQLSAVKVGDTVLFENSPLEKKIEWVNEVNYGVTMRFEIPKIISFPLDRLIFYGEGSWWVRNHPLF
ncbi:MAG: hypothetical protein HC892_00025 [Saprospiraceae bacterium]|nr:hypothetical protein [Saprospiraceae bacterium]